MALTFTDATETSGRIGVAKTKYYLGTTAADPATDAYTEIRGVVSFPDFGHGLADEVSSPEIGSAGNKKDKGLIQYGGGDLTANYYPDDAGQHDLADAADDFGADDYNFAVVLPDKISTRGTTFFIKGKVRGFNVEAVNGPNNIYKVKAPISFNSTATKVAAS